MDGLKQWLISLVFSAIAGTLISVISPEGSNDKTLKTIIGIFIISAVCLPLSEMQIKDFSLPAFEEINEYDSNLHMNDFLIESLEKELFEKANEVAKDFGCELDEIAIEAEYDEENCIIIHEMIVYFKDGNSENVYMATEKIENELGVPVIAE